MMCEHSKSSPLVPVVSVAIAPLDKRVTAKYPELITTQDDKHR